MKRENDYMLLFLHKFCQFLLRSIIFTFCQTLKAFHHFALRHSVIYRLSLFDHLNSEFDISPFIHRLTHIIEVEVPVRVGEQISAAVDAQIDPVEVVLQSGGHHFEYIDCLGNLG